MSGQNPVTPEEYQQVFETNKTGARVFEDLLNRFGPVPSKQGGIDRILNQFEYAGQRRVLEFITLMCNRANGVDDQIFDTINDED